MKHFIDENSFQKPSYAPESAWHKHSPFAFWLLAKKKPKRIVELGVHNGFSFFVFCQQVKQSRAKAKCYAVDHWEGDVHAGFYDASIYEKFKMQQELYAHESEVLRCSFDEALSSFPDKSIDLLHIDGRHFYDDVKADFNSWKVKLNNDAIVLLHDTQVFERGFGVHQLWEELVDEYPLTFEFKFGHGLGVLCYGDGKTISRSLLNLFSLSKPRKDAIEAIYKALGNQIHYEYLLEAYNVSYDCN